MNGYVKILLILFLLLISYSLFHIPEAKAATFYFKGEVVKSGSFSKLNLKVLVDSNEPLNVYDLAIEYPERLLDFQFINNSGSIIDIWQSQKRPVSPGLLEIAGGSLTPFTGTGGEVATIEFLVVGAGTDELRFARAGAYIADGFGTPAEVQAEATPLTIQDIKFLSFEEAELLAAPELTETLDENPPVITFLEIHPNPFESGKNLLVFMVKDAESGFSHVQVRTKSGFSWGEWQEVTNPYPLDKNVWAVDLRVYDNAGNFVEKRLYSWRNFVVPLFALVLVFILAGFIVIRRQRNRV